MTLFALPPRTRTCKTCHLSFPITDFFRHYDKECRKHFYQHSCKRCATGKQMSQRRKARRTIEGWAIERAKRIKLKCVARNIPFNITPQDLMNAYPQNGRCPALGILLEIGVVYQEYVAPDTAPTIDRIIPSLGYVKGNICVISKRANAIKQNADAHELRLVARWLTDIERNQRTKEASNDDASLLF